MPGVCLIPDDRVFPTDIQMPHEKHHPFSAAQMQATVQKCHEVLAQRGGDLVVYCSGAMSRSPGVVCALLMGKTNCSFEEAKALIMQNRAWPTRIVTATQNMLRGMQPAAFNAV